MKYSRFPVFSAASHDFQGAILTKLFQGTIDRHMADISLLKNSARALSRHRLVSAVFSGAKSLATSFARTFYSLWLENVGLPAAVFTGRAGFETITSYRAYGMSGDPKALLVTRAVALFCGWFSVACFEKAKRMRK